LSSEVRIALPRAQVLSVLHDKYRSLVAAKQAGLDVPAFATAEDLQQLRERTAEIGCPVVVRPIVSGSRLKAAKAVTLKDLSDIDRQLGVDPLPAMLIQRRFSGARMNVYFAARDGEMLAEQHAHCLRSDRADGTGLTIDLITIAPIACISRETRMLVRELRYTGVGCAQFLYDAPRDKPCFLEINARFGANYALVEAAGMGLTGLAYDLAWNDPRPVRDGSDRCDVGTRLVWTLGDVSGLLLALKHGDIGAAGALKWAGRTLLAAARADVHATWSWADPLPTLMLYARRVGSRLGLAIRDVN
jgi:biotin carboxylase